MTLLVIRVLQLVKVLEVVCLRVELLLLVPVQRLPLVRQQLGHGSAVEAEK
jgi:hypothetical protein